MLSSLPLTLRLLGFGLLLFAISGPLHRFGGFHYRLALLVLAAGAILMAIGAVQAALLLAASLRQGGPFPLAVALLLVPVLGALGMVGYQVALGVRVPVIHDITTDPDDPPAFVYLAELRRAAGAESPAEYDGAETARKQRESYPDLAPLRLPLAAGDALHRASQVAERLGWEVQAVAPLEGRLEATARTKWFGFVDDVVVRVRADGAGSLVDIRSKSRVGRSDLGANAARIRAFLGELGRGMER